MSDENEAEDKDANSGDIAPEDDEDVTPLEKTAEAFVQSATQIFLMSEGQNPKNALRKGLLEQVILGPLAQLNAAAALESELRTSGALKAIWAKIEASQQLWRVFLDRLPEIVKEVSREIVESPVETSPELGEELSPETLRGLLPEELCDKLYPPLEEWAQELLVRARHHLLAEADKLIAHAKKLHKAAGHDTPAAD